MSKDEATDIIKNSDLNNRWIIIEIWNIKVFLVYIYQKKKKKKKGEREKIEKCQDLRRELQKIWNVRVKIVPLIVGSLGAIPKQFGNRLKETGITAEVGQVQKTVLLGTARILRKVNEI